MCGRKTRGGVRRGRSNRGEEARGGKKGHKIELKKGEERTMGKRRRRGAKKG